MTMTQFKTCVRRVGIVVCLLALIVIIVNVTRAYGDTVPSPGITDPATGQVLDPSVDTSVGATYDPSQVDYSNVDLDPVDNATFIKGTTYDPMAGVVNDDGVLVTDTGDSAIPDAHGNYSAGCDARSWAWTAKEGSSITIGKVTMTAHRCWNSHGKLKQGDERITQRYDRTKAAVLTQYNFSGQGTRLDYQDINSAWIDAFGHAQLCTGIWRLKVCAFDEQFIGGVTMYSPWWVDHTTVNNPYDWTKPGQRYDVEKGYHLSFSSDGRQ